MSGAIHLPKALLAVLLAAFVTGCEEEPTASETAGPSKAAVASAVPPPAPTPTRTAPPPKPREDCPEGSTGIGTFEKPCVATGAARLMEVSWTGKTGDAGPSFRVINKSKLTIIYGAIVVYFYDKAGKQLEVTEGSKKLPNQLCSGKIFAGVMKPDEKAVLTFSCVRKDHVPEGTVSIEAEMQTVGFVDESGTKTEFYWRNKDLAPDARPKGGVKSR
jgi:hypothetical protein